MNSSLPAASVVPMRAKSKRPSSVKPLLFATLALGSVVAMLVTSLWGPSYAQSDTERVVEFKIPKHVPIKVKLKKEKEQAIKDLRNEKWYQDFQIEVTNTSDKPIYYLNIWLVYPEIISESGKRVGVVLRYGRMDFVDFNSRLVPSDVPILPGATISLEIPEQDQKGWVFHKTHEGRSDPKKVEVELTQVSFGDGTGFNGSDGRPYPFNRTQSSNRLCSEEQKEPPEKNNKRLSRFNALFQAYSPRQPAGILPVNFFCRRVFSLQTEYAVRSLLSGDKL